MNNSKPQKLTFSKQKKCSRFDNYSLTEDLKHYELFGLLPNETEYKLASAGVDRNENVTLVLSNSSSKDTILLKLRSRSNGQSIVVLESILRLVLENEVYEFEQTEVYDTVSLINYSGRVMQYGSKGSCLKLFILNPYRNLRLVFRGHMRRVNSSEETETKFIKLNFVINSTSGIYDFLYQFNPKYLKSTNSKTKELFFHDRHEQSVRALGEYIISGEDNNKLERFNLILWGFHSKQVIDQAETSTNVQNKRILAHLINGQIFHIGNNRIINAHNKLPDNMDFGYTCFEVYSGLTPINKPFIIDWNKVEEDANEFDLEVSGEGRKFDCKLKRRFSNIKQFFDIEMNGKNGWAFVESSENLFSDTKEDREKWQQLLNSYIKSSEIAAEELSNSDQQHHLLADLKDSDGHISSDFVGAKAFSLTQLSKFSNLSKINYIVPQAFVLTRYAYEKIFKENNPTFGEEVERLKLLIGEGQLDELQDKCRRLKEIIENSDLIEEVIQELSNKLNLFDNDMTFAVRSSSWGEDEEDMSAAGQLSTYLGVSGLEEISRAVMKCFASKYSYENVEYKRQHGLGLDLPMAVIVQEMIECDKAGVLFTCDPTSGDSNLLLITANYGLGESVVSGQSEPDTIKVRVFNEEQVKIEQVVIGSKKIIINQETIKSNQNLDDLKTKYDRTKCCLNDDEILKLAYLGLELANHYKSQRDIEWGFKGDQLYLFQSRPITNLDAFTERELLHELDQSSRAELEFLTRANVGEVVPYAVKPLTYTFMTKTWKILGTRIFHKFHKLAEYEKQVAIWPDTSNYDVLLHGYHLFFNMRCSSLIPTSIEDDDYDKNLLGRSMEVAIFGHEIGDQPELKEASNGLTKPKSLFESSRFLAYSMNLLLKPTKVIMREKARMTKLRLEMRNLKYAKDYETNKMLGLFNQLRSLGRFCELANQNHLTIVLLTGANNVVLSKILAKYIKDPVQLFTKISKILGSSPNVISAEIPQRIDSMAQLIRAKGSDKVEQFLNLSEAGALNFILNNGEDEKLTKEFNDFIDKFGHRCYNEVEISERSWRESPGVIIEMLKTNCRRNTKELSSLNELKNSSIDEIIESLGIDFTFKDRCLLKYVIIPKCRALVAARELTKDIFIDHTDIIREASRMLAKEMRRNMRIPDEDLFYYLTYCELESFIQTDSPQPTVVVQAIRRRNMFKSMFKEPWLFDEIIKGPEIVPNHHRKTMNKEILAAIENAPKLYGTPASCGKVEANVCLVMEYGELDKVRSGEILVTHSTDIGFSPVFPLLAGIITEVGGLISHGAVVAREYGLPSVLGIPNVTQILKNGEKIILDADNGVIVRLSCQDQSSLLN